ncbi:MAG: FtsX-like permease family protein [Candidatus Njordarchaeales archaeon]
MLRLVFKRGLFVPLFLTVCLVSTIMLSVLLMSEYVAYAQLTDSLDRALIDAKMIIRTTNFKPYKQLYADIYSLPEVSWEGLFFSREELEIIIQKEKLSFYPKTMGKELLLLGMNSSEWVNNISILEGVFPNSINEVAVDPALAALLNISVGDRILVTMIYGNASMEFVVSGIIKLSGLLSKIIYNDYPIQYRIPLTSLNTSREYLGICIFSLESMVSSEGIGGLFPGLPVYVMKFNRRFFFDPWNPDRILRGIKNIEGKIVDKALKYVGITQITFYNYAKTVVEDYLAWPSAFRLQLTYAILLVIFAGGLYSIIIGWIFLNARRKEIALLRIRGFSDRQIGILLVLEYFFVSIIGGLLGLGLSTLIACIAPKFFLPYFSSRYDPVPLILSSTPNYLSAAIIYSLILGFLAVIPSSIQALKINVMEGLSEYLEEIEKEKLSSWILIGLIVGIGSFIEVLWDLPVFKLALNNLMRSATALLQVFGFIIFVTDSVILSTGPFLLAYSLSMVVSHYSSRMEGLLSKLSSLIIPKNISDTAVKHFTRRPSRISRMIFITAIVLALLIEAGLNSSITISSLKKQTQLFVGADCRVDIIRYTQPISSSQLELLIKGLENQAKVSEASEAWGSTRFIGRSLYIKVIGVDEEYFSVAFMDENYFVGVDLKSVYESLFIKREALLSISAHDSLGINIGDNLSVVVSARYGFTKKLIRVRVAGFISFLPGLLFDIYDAQKADYVIMLVSRNIIKDILPLPSKILIDLPHETDHYSFGEKLASLLGENGILATIYPYQTVLKLALENSLPGIIATIYRLEFLELIALTGFGIYLIFVSEYIARRREFALLWARGIKREEIASIATVEAFLTAMFSMIVGFIIAYDFSTSLAKFVNIGLIGFLKPPEPIGAVLPIDLIWVVAAQIVIIYIAAKVAMRYALRYNFAQQLRIHY